MRKAWPILWLLFPGCIPVVPHYDWRVPSRMNMDKVLESFEVTPETRDEDVAIALGEPDRVVHTPVKSWIYQWEKVSGVSSGCGFPSQGYTTGYVLQIDFDGKGRVTRMSPVETVPGAVYALYPWD